MAPIRDPLTLVKHDPVNGDPACVKHIAVYADRVWTQVFEGECPQRNLRGAAPKIHRGRLVPGGPWRAPDIAGAPADAGEPGALAQAGETGSPADAGEPYAGEPAAAAPALPRR